MKEKSELYRNLQDFAYEHRIQKPEIPKYITDNIKYKFFEWQQDALEALILYNEVKNLKMDNRPTHLMFNMATGTGKTLLMAACILYYYNMGYRKFLFFVNQNNIVDKTENNFINKEHYKYLFKDKISINQKNINIKEVERFTDSEENIEIKFTTIQKLYNDIHMEKENSLTYRDLLKYNIIMLADEAHHLNSNTLNETEQLEIDLPIKIDDTTSEEEIERKGWEDTVINLILNKNSSENDFGSENKNVLLEFTATLPENENVYKKYKDKIIFKFGLKEFLKRGYTKEINLISSTLNKKERILQALLINWYRSRIALKNNIFNFKPVILFRSKTIEESKEDFAFFNDIITNLSEKDFEFLKDIEDKLTESDDIYEQGKSRMQDVLYFIKKEKIQIFEIVDYLKFAFDKVNCMITNSKDNKAKTKEKTTEEQDAILNNLEDENNNIRAIFTVKRLTEGWDVLNLYDIVRLYQGQNAGGKTKKTPKATIQEKQLIGRGVRYFPFEYKDKPINKRKFDDDLKNELRILEELFFYTYDEDSRYISHLKAELKKDGYIQDNKITKKFDIKEKFKKSKLYNEGIVWINTKIDNPDSRKTSIEEIDKDFFGTYTIKRLQFNEQEIDFENKNDKERISIVETQNHTLNVKIKEFNKQIFYKAISILCKDEFYTFDNLRKMLEINSTEELLSEKFLGDFEIKILNNEKTIFENIKNEIKLHILIEFLKKFKTEFTKTINPYVGTEQFTPIKLKDIYKEPKIKIVEYDEESEILERDLKNIDWYILDAFYGTSEEKALIKFIKDTMINLKEKYKNVYLLRNEEIYKIYDKKGTGFEPDFILFMQDKKSTKLHYQIFIEPKGQQLLEKDSWKNEF